jgi:UDP-glucose 4-epimerase
MNILVTGSSGFIGSNLIHKLKNYNNLLTPSRNELDLFNSENVKYYLYKHKPECIVHLAANPNNKPDDNNPNLILSDNILGTHNLLYYAPPQCRFIFASTICVYGNSNTPPIESSLHNPTSSYGATKSACESLINVYTNQERIRGVSLRLCAVVGKGLTHGILYDFLRKIKEQKDYLEVFGNEPGSIKHFIHVDDVINAIIFMIDNPYITYPVNIVPDGLLSVKDIANLVIELTRSTKQIKWLGTQSVWRGDQNLLQASNQLMKNLGIYCVSSKSAMTKAIIENTNSYQI